MWYLQQQQIIDCFAHDILKYQHHQQQWMMMDYQLNQQHQYQDLYWFCSFTNKNVFYFT